MTHDEVAQAYRRYGHLVLRRCRRILRGDVAAEDVLQEVFVRLWRYGDAFAAAEAKLPWLYRVADRCCFDQMSRRRARVEVPIDEDADVPAVGAAQAVEDREIVLRFLARFDDRLKQVAVLHYIDELTQEEIAAATGWSRQTIFKKLAFLRERATRLRATLCGEPGGHMSVHPSPQLLERLSVDDLAEPLASETARHTASCDACRGFLDELESARGARLQAVPPELFVARVAARRDRGASLARRRIVAGVLTAALAAAAAFLLVPRSAMNVGLKGTGVTVHRNRGGQVHILGSEDTIRAGDALRIVLTSSRATTVAAWFVDARGRVDPLLQGQEMTLPAGEQAFPESAIVESPCLDLKLVITLGPTEPATIERALRQAVARGLPAGNDWLPAGALTRTFRCE